jgi:hypothetical protein
MVAFGNHAGAIEHVGRARWHNARYQSCACGCRLVLQLGQDCRAYEL